VTREDPYGWLRDDNWRAVMRDPAVLGGEIRAYLEAENAYTKAAMAPTEALQRRLFGELKPRYHSLASVCNRQRRRGD
jgi:oligopeptidase B